MRLKDEMERMEEKQTDQGTVWGNDRGHQFFDSISRLEGMMAANKDALEKSKKEREAFQEKLGEHEAKIGAYEVKIAEHEAKSKEERSAFEARIAEHEEKSKEERSAFETKSKEERSAFEAKSKEERSAFEVKIAEHEAKIGEHEAEITKLTRKGEAHEARIRDLTRSSKGYFDIRSRFLCVYQRDHPKGKVPEDSKGPRDSEDPEGPKDPGKFKERLAITVGNERAHSGDAAMDAIVHRDSPAGHFEDHTFRDLYYIDYKKALELGTLHKGLTHSQLTGCSDAAASEGKIPEAVFQMLDKRGTLVAAGKSFPKDVEESFVAYMDGIDDDPAVVAERGRKLWPKLWPKSGRMKS